MLEFGNSATSVSLSDMNLAMFRESAEDSPSNEQGSGPGAGLYPEGTCIQGNSDMRNDSGIRPRPSDFEDSPGRPFNT